MAMPPLIFQSYLFEGALGPNLTQADRERSRLVLLGALTFLTAIDKLWLAQYPTTKKLYSSGVRYHHDNGVENWFDIPTSAQEGYGDCKVFCAWRCAELQKQGIKAAPFITWRQLPDGNWMYHCLVWRPRGSIMKDPPPFLEVPGKKGGFDTTLWPSTLPGDTGYIEDPSRVLGMTCEEFFATTNQKPSSAAFQAQLAVYMDRPITPVQVNAGSADWRHHERS